MAGEALPRPLLITDVPGAKIQPTVGTLAAGLLDVLVRVHRPRDILEIGTALGYCACVFGHAAATYGGKVTTLEINPELAIAARQNVAAQGLSETVTVITADAAVWMKGTKETFGLILQDGAKNYLDYLERTVGLLKPGGLLVTDDILFAVMDDLPGTLRTMIDEYNHALQVHPQLRTAWLPIGDGVAISVKTG